MTNKNVSIREAQISLVSRLLNGPGEARADHRRAAFDNSGLDTPLRGLINKVAVAPTTICESDFTSSIQAGFSEDQLFELVICAAIGQSSREYQSALDALDSAATTGGETDAP